MNNFEIGDKLQVIDNGLFKDKVGIYLGSDYLYNTVFIKFENGKEIEINEERVKRCNNE